MFTDQSLIITPSTFQQLKCVKVYVWAVERYLFFWLMCCKLIKFQLAPPNAKGQFTVPV